MTEMDRDRRERLAAFVVHELVTDPADGEYAKAEIVAGRFKTELYPGPDGLPVLAVTVGADDDPRSFELLTSPDPDDHLAALLDELGE